MAAEASIDEREGNCQSSLDGLIAEKELRSDWVLLADLLEEE